jgi:hypothetical protein
MSHLRHQPFCCLLLGSSLRTEWTLRNATHRWHNIRGTAQYISKGFWLTQYIAQPFNVTTKRLILCNFKHCTIILRAA